MLMRALLFANNPASHGETGLQPLMDCFAEEALSLVISDKKCTS